ncbi:unnamed protein product [Bursaphelenchus xylophilus]|uniref:(pine wood nematode) hypothetical protein n=1 Tax=Bursaphelenchus xylophilus TaxID=6326 RepID=A0A1I7S5G4_BURXY|nr:unnamed protein product [Bursaphelenchus xylophilus]CAG9118046.1 unnamed protein product [Bursaphelenchus xylophilus]
MTIKVQLLLSAILSTVVSAEFDEVLAKTKFFPLAAAAYTTFPVKCVKNVFDDAEVTKTVTAECGKMPGEWKVCFGFTGVSHTDKAIFLAY